MYILKLAITHRLKSFLNRYTVRYVRTDVIGSRTSSVIASVRSSIH